MTTLTCQSERIYKSQRNQRLAAFASFCSRLLKHSGIIITTFLLSSCQTEILNPVGPVGTSERTILLNSLAIMLVIVIPTIILTLVFAWWFRASNKKAHYRPDWEYSGRLELLVWSIPMLVIIFLGGITWIGSHDLAPEKPLQSEVPAMQVEVVALDWKWLFIYPEQSVASVNQLVIPVGTPITFHITSATVMNSFFIPQLGSQIYAMSGMTARLNLQADKPGQYHGFSAHYSGEGFADMNFKVDALSSEKFAYWVTNTKRSGPMLDNESYRALVQKNATSEPYTYRSVSAGLFDNALHEAGMPVQETATDGREN